MRAHRLHELSAFTDHPAGGNPAGVWIGEVLPDPETMRAIAARLGHSETAFLAPSSGEERIVRYFSPKAEVAFCGHATIASGVVLGREEGPGTYRLQTRSGEVPVVVSRQGERWTASLTSVATRHAAPDATLLADVLRHLGWQRDDLDPALPPTVAYAGAYHLVLAVRERARLDALDYDFDPMAATMLAADLTTLQLVWRESPAVFHARDPFPVGGVVEDPATGAAAAALGGYLRDGGFEEAPFEFTVLQGEKMGRASRLVVRVPASGGVIVEGEAVELRPLG